MAERRIKFTYDHTDPLARAMERAGLIPPGFKRDPTMGDVTDPSTPTRVVGAEDVAEAVRGLNRISPTHFYDDDAYNIDEPISHERCGIRIRLRPGKSRTDDASRDYAAASAREILLRLLKPPFVLEKPAVARGDDFVEQYFLTKKKRDEPKNLRHLLARDLRTGAISLHCFLIEHDWAAVLRGATAGAKATAGPESGGDARGALSGEWMLPFELCTFELRINGVHVVIIASQLSGPTTTAVHARPQPSTDISFRYGFRVDKNVWGFGETFYEALSDHWHPSTSDTAPGPVQTPFVDLLYQQLRACCIMLDAEVAVAPTIREPYRSNRPPPEPGAALPAFSFHIVSLSRKSRAEPHRISAGPPDPDAPARRSPRLHFRRGHWRYYSNYRIWLKWNLVGDPDLGWVEKDYKL